MDDVRVGEEDMEKLLELTTFQQCVHVCVCIHEHVRAGACTCVHACVRVCVYVCVSECARICVCMHATVCDCVLLIYQFTCKHIAIRY